MELKTFGFNAWIEVEAESKDDALDILSDEILRINGTSLIDIEGDYTVREINGEEIK